MSTRAGRLDVRITIQRRSATSDGAGEPVEAWVPVVSNRAAMLTPVRGDERFTVDQFTAREQVEFYIRWSQDVADLSPLDRVVYPASAATESPGPGRSFYDIMAVHQVGRGEGLRLVTARHADTVSS